MTSKRDAAAFGVRRDERETEHDHGVRQRRPEEDQRSGQPESSGDNHNEVRQNRGAESSEFRTDLQEYLRIPQMGYILLHAVSPTNTGDVS